MGGEENINHKKEKLKKWLKDKYNLAFVAILIFAITIRFYYFLQTASQPLWWDEAVYGSIAKNLISHTWDKTDFMIRELQIRPILLPLIWSFLMRLGIGESGSRFVLEFLPSIFSVLFVYLTAKELYDKKIALLSTFIFSVLWIHLFYTVRILTNVPAMVFLFSSMYFFIKSTKQTKLNYSLFGLSLFLLSISVIIRYPVGLIFIVYFLYLILQKKLYLNKKYFWISGISGVIPLILFFIYNFMAQGNIFPALLGNAYVTANLEESAPFAFYVLNFIPLYLQTIFFILFLIGIFLICFELVIGFNFILKSRKLQNHFFVVSILLVFLLFFIFYIRGAEDRWLLPLSFSMVCVSAYGCIFIYTFTKKFQKQLAILLIISLLLFGAYNQIKFADNLIDNKKQSYLQVQQGFEWIKSSTHQESVLTGSAIDPYAVYYAEREFIRIPSENPDFSEIEKADYLIAHIFTPQPGFLTDYLNSNQDKWQPINAFFLDEQNQQPGLIVYQKIK